jgi:hypothetical protein
LLGPAQILIGGTGTGNRAIDGRSRQPGLGTKRPRGFLPGDRIPIAARVAVPGLPGAAMLLQANHGRAPIRTLVAIIQPLAKAASRRARSIERVLAGRRRSPRKSKGLLDLAGPIEGGLLTKKDLNLFDCRPLHASSRTASRGPHGIAEPSALSISRGVRQRGILSVASETAEDGLRIETRSPRSFDAGPSCSVTRRSPGDPLLAPCSWPSTARRPAAPNEVLLEENIAGSVTAGFGGVRDTDLGNSRRSAPVMKSDIPAKEAEGTKCVSLNIKTKRWQNNAHRRRLWVQAQALREPLCDHARSLARSNASASPDTHAATASASKKKKSDLFLEVRTHAATTIHDARMPTLVMRSCVENCITNAASGSGAADRARA